MSTPGTVGTNRLPAPAGLLINRQRPLQFHFDGREYTGLFGDTIASALAANGVWLLSRSFKYHRPRGAMSFAGLEADTLVRVGDEPNVPADLEPLQDGMRIEAQNCPGGLRHDWMAVTGLGARFMPVGFYYKSMFRPRGIWPLLWEPLIRRMAGLGRVQPDANSTVPCCEKEYRFCEVAVVGGGPAGMAAALRAADEGARVLLLEQAPVPGGVLNYGRFVNGDAGQTTLVREQLIAAIRQQQRIELMTDTVCNAWYADHWLAAIHAQRLYKIRAHQTILATGLMEQPIVFRNNDLPGILLGTAAQRLIRLYGVRPGQKAVVLSIGDDGYAVASDLQAVGTKVAAVVDIRTTPPAALVAKADKAGIPVISGSTVYEACKGKGGLHLGAVKLARVINQQDGRSSCTPLGTRIECDLLCSCGGYMSAYQLALQAGGRLVCVGQAETFSITGLPAGMHLAGAVNGVVPSGDPAGMAAVMEDGKRAGDAAVATLPGRTGKTPHDRQAVERTQPDPTEEAQQTTPYPLFPHPRGKEFVDRDEDLQIADILNACADGYADLELVKRYSTVGMGPSQGRHSALATARLVAWATSRTVGDIGVTTARPPLCGEQLAVLAGRSFYPERHTALHGRHLEANAHMVPAGTWLRPAWYGTERTESIREEALAIRKNVGIIDVSTLGGLEVKGPDAAEFLNRIYTFAYLKQAVGRTRYVLMTNLAGSIIDDGVSCRFGTEHFYVTATTGGVDNVYRTMLWWNAQWRLDISVSNVTAAWAGVSLAGPGSREVLSHLCEDIDLSPQAFPYLGVRSGTVRGIPARILRVGFVGELSYEIHVPSSMGEALWDALLEVGRGLGIRAVGIEAQRILRLEKGHIIVGQDTDAMTTPQEAQMGWAIARRKPFFVGGRALQIREQHPQRRLVAFTIDDPQLPCPQESSLVLDGSAIAGHVTSVTRSPALGYIIGLACTRPDTEIGDTLHIKLGSGDIIAATVVKSPFYDPENKRQEM